MRIRLGERRDSFDLESVADRAEVDAGLLGSRERLTCLRRS